MTCSQLPSISPSTPTRCHRRLHGNEPRLSPHQLDQADPVARRAGLHLGRQKGPLGLLDGRVEAKAPEGGGEGALTSKALPHTSIWASRCFLAILCSHSMQSPPHASFFSPPWADAHPSPSPPPHLSISRMSLSMDLGTPTTQQLTSCCWHISLIALAPALPPLPPTTKSMSMPHMSIRFTISLGCKERGRKGRGVERDRYQGDGVSDKYANVQLTQAFSQDSDSPTK